MRRAGLVLGLGLAAFTAAAVLAAWSAQAAGSGSSGARTLPGGNTPTVAVSEADVTVVWTQVTFAGSLLGTYADGGYLITRYADGSAVAIAPGGDCAGIISGAGATLSCTEAAVPDGTWRYTVTPVFASWRGTESDLSDAVTTLNDTTPPSSSITFPAEAGAYNGAGWTAGCVTPAADDICGSASDAGSGVQTVEVSVRLGSGNYWGGSAFDSGSEVWFPADGTTAWSFGFPSANYLADGEYTIRSRATDQTGNVEATPPATTFTIDRTAPTIVRSDIVDGTTNSRGFFTEGGPYYVYAKVTDVDSDVATVTADVGAITTGATAVPMTTTGGPWNIDGREYTHRSAVQTANASAPESGNPYPFTITANDAAGNMSSLAETASVDYTAPTIVRHTVADATTNADGFFTQGGDYFVYARVTDPQGSGVATVTADVGAITTGATAVPMTTTGGPWDIGNRTYTYRSAVQTANASAPESGNPYPFSVAATDQMANSTTSAGTAQVDYTAPTIVRVAVANAINDFPVVKQGGGYYVYARVTDAGSDVGTVTGNAGNLTTGATSVPMTKGSWTIDGRSYNHRSDLLTANGSLPESGNPYSFTVAASDNMGNAAAPFSGTVNVDNTAATATNVQATNVTGGTIGLAEQNDKITFTFSEQVAPGSVATGWSGSSTTVTVKLARTGTANVVLTVWDSTGTTQLNLGSVDLGRTDYLAGAGDKLGLFTGSSMVQSGATITITLGTSAGDATATAAGTSTMTWAPATAATDRAGNAMSGASVNESGTADKEF